MSSFYSRATWETQEPTECIRVSYGEHARRISCFFQERGEFAVAN